MKKKLKKQINQLCSMYDLLSSAIFVLQCDNDFDLEETVNLLKQSKEEFTRSVGDSKNEFYEIENEDFYDY